jgi:hypothetical protein
MKQKTISRELLLFKSTSFSKRLLSARENFIGEMIDADQQLERACWSGFILELVLDDGEYSLWESFVYEVTPAKKFIRVKLGVTPGPVEVVSSVDPYFFLEVQNFN